MTMVKLERIGAWLTARLQHKWGLALFPLPLLFGLAAKLFHSRTVFGDYQAIACAGQKALDGGAMYDLHLACNGMNPSVYVYGPWVAQVAAWVERLCCEPALFATYLALYLLALAVLVWLPLSRSAPGALTQRLPFVAFLSGSAFMWGNVAVILHGLILGTALLFEAAPWLFIAAVVVAAWVKPVFLAYLIVPLIADMPYTRRLGLVVAGLAAGLAPTIAFALTGGQLAGDWYALLSHFAYDQKPGDTFFGWMSMFGARGNEWPVQVLYLIYAATLTGSGWALARNLRLTPVERVWLGLSLGVLLFPRLLSQDIFLLGPGLALLAARSSRDRLILLGGCILALIGGFIGMRDVTTPLALFAVAVYVLWRGAEVARPSLAYLRHRLRPIRFPAE